MQVKPIGMIRTSFRSDESLPIQSSKSHVKGEIELKDEYKEGLASLNGFSHIILLYWFHRAKPPSMLVIPYLDQKEHGLFATRAPARPNPIGLSIVRLLEIKGNKLIFEGADMLDGTPLLDIKPYVPGFDHRPTATSGWLEGFNDEQGPYESDDRFHE